MSTINQEKLTLTPGKLWGGPSLSAVSTIGYCDRGVKGKPDYPDVSAEDRGFAVKSAG